jgi:hypothetical protein
MNKKTKILLTIAIINSYGSNLYQDKSKNKTDKTKKLESELQKLIKSEENGQILSIEKQHKNASLERSISSKKNIHRETQAQFERSLKAPHISTIPEETEIKKEQTPPHSAEPKKESGFTNIFSKPIYNDKQSKIKKEVEKQETERNNNFIKKNETITAWCFRAKKDSYVFPVIDNISKVLYDKNGPFLTNFFITTYNQYINNLVNNEDIQNTQEGFEQGISAIKNLEDKLSRIFFTLYLNNDFNEKDLILVWKLINCLRDYIAHKDSHKEEITREIIKEKINTIHQYHLSGENKISLPDLKKSLLSRLFIYDFLINRK